MLKLRRRAVRHFVTLIEICVHLIRVNPGHICDKGSPCLTPLSNKKDLEKKTII